MKYVWSAAGLDMVAFPILTTQNAVKRDGKITTDLFVNMKKINICTSAHVNAMFGSSYLEY